MTPLEVISLGGLLPGTLDLAATSTLLGIQGVPVERLLQTIASGALGPSAFQGRKRTATAGLFFHFFIAFTATSLYYVSTRKITALLDYPLLSGILYGVAVHLVMSRVVVPSPPSQNGEFSARAFLTQLIIHIVCIGPPIALVVGHFSR